MIGIDIVENIDIAEVIFESMYNIFSRSTSEIQFTQNIFKLIKSDISKRK